ncbi:MAG: LysR family transcriptional regulator [Phascolarctobacterium sp.]|nr:LysR family transcriptional regulator [Phascolarctobacterium sp.]MCQ2373831.1 LysR family transcriptional regulator [Phascolarctobacterium sp.]
MNIQVYKSFLTVVGCKSFTLAAKALNFSQPTISNHIANLEEIYGVTFFARDGKNVYLTAAGSVFVPIAKRMIEEYEAGIEEMSAFHEEGDVLRIAVSTQFINNYLVHILNKLKDEFPELDISVDRRMTIPDAIEDTFTKKKYDFAFLHMDMQPMYTKRIRLWGQRLVWVVGKDLYEKQNKNNNIYDYPFIGYGSFTEYYPLLASAVKLENFTSKFSFNDSESILEAVVNNYGIAVVPEIKVKRYLERGEVVCFPDKYSISLPVNVLYDLEMNMTPSKKRFLDLLLASKLS